MASRFFFEEGDAPHKLPTLPTARFSAVDVDKLAAALASASAKAAKPAAAAAAPAKPAATAAAPVVGGAAELEAAIAAQGQQVAELKASQAAADVIKQAVDKLLELKNSLPEGHALRPVSRSDKKKAEKAGGAAQPQAAAGAAAPSKQAEPELDEAQAAIEKAKVEQLLALKSDRFGVRPLLQSKPEDKQGRIFTIVGDVASKLGSKVLIRGYVHAIKSPAAATFVVVRQRLHTVQCVVEGADAALKEFVDKVTIESVVDVVGTVVAATVKATTITTVEIKVESFFVVQLARVRLAFQPREAERPPPTEEEEQAEREGKKKLTKNVLQDMRLDHRTLDLRTPAMQAISRISDHVVRLFSEYLRSQGFVEIMTPKLLAGASEGGADVFKTDYFGQVACLAQSPQLHKQLCCACSGFERVFEIGPVFRAEKSLTSRHMTEFHGLDVEMAINEHYHEMLSVFSSLFFYIFDGINRDCKNEMEIVRLFSPFTDLVYRRPGHDSALILTFAEAIEMLEADKGEGHISAEDLAKLKSLSADSDPSTPVEKRLGALVKAKYGVDFYMLDKYPSAVRPFYTMPDPNDPRLSNSYDFFIRGQEILSGAQRIHDADMLERAVVARGIPKKSLHFYIDAFRDGALPHAGGGIGLERVVMLFLALPNIRWASLFSRDPKRLSP